MYRFNFFETRYRHVFINFLILLFGIFLVVIGTVIFPTTIIFTNVNFGSVISNVGALIGIIGLMQGVYEAVVRRKFFEEIFTSVFTSKAIFDAGVVDAAGESHTVNLSDVIARADELILVFAHSKQFFERYHEQFRDRCNRGKTTEIFLNHPDSKAVKYYVECGRDRDYVTSSIGEFIREVQSVDRGKEKKITIHKVDIAPKYSLVMSDKDAYLIFSTSSEGQASVPQITVRKDSPLWIFIKNDLQHIRDHHVLETIS